MTSISYLYDRPSPSKARAQAREIAQSVARSLCKCEALNLIPIAHLRELSVVAYVCNASTGKAETKASLGLTDKPV